jgi:hypothetical protein
MEPIDLSGKTFCSNCGMTIYEQKIVEEKELPKIIPENIATIPEDTPIIKDVHTEVSGDGLVNEDVTSETQEPGAGTPTADKAAAPAVKIPISTVSSQTQQPSAQEVNNAVTSAPPQKISVSVPTPQATTNPAPASPPTPNNAGTTSPETTPEEEHELNIQPAPQTPPKQPVDSQPVQNIATVGVPEQKSSDSMETNLIPEISLSTPPTPTVPVATTPAVSSASEITTELTNPNKPSDKEILEDLVDEKTVVPQEEKDKSDKIFSEKVKEVDTLGASGILLDILDDKAVEKKNEQELETMVTAAELVGKVQAKAPSEVQEPVASPPASIPSTPSNPVKTDSPQATNQPNAPAGAMANAGNPVPNAIEDGPKLMQPDEIEALLKKQQGQSTPQANTKNIDENDLSKMEFSQNPKEENGEVLKSYFSNIFRKEI